MAESWDRANRTLAANISIVAKAMKLAAEQREAFSADLVKDWHRLLMAGLEPDRPEDKAFLAGQQWRGVFRGEGQSLEVNVAVGGMPGVHFDEVCQQVDEFFEDAEELFAALDARIGADPVEGDDDVEDVLRLAARLHAEWVRIHPFANGNGRTARLIAQFVGLRYGLRHFLPVRPRPQGNYGAASKRAMTGDWKPTFEVFLACFRKSGKPT